MKTQRELAIAICEALHLPPADTQRIEIVVEPSHVTVKATVRFEQGGEKFVSAVAECDVIPKGNGEVLDVKLKSLHPGTDVTSLMDRVRRLVTVAPLPSRP